MRQGLGSQFGAVLGAASLKPWDTSTPEGRSKERYRRVVLTVLTSASAKAVGLVSMIVSVPLTIKYLGTERYALWMTISSTMAMLTFADLGIGNGLLNAVSESHGKNDEQAARTYVSSAFFMLSLIGAAILLALAVGYPFVPWQKLFNIHSPLAMSEAGPAVAVFIACFGFGMPLGVVQRTEMGYQDGFTNNLWVALGGLLGLGGLLLAIYLQAGLPWLVLAIAGGPVVATALNGANLFGVQRSSLLPRWSAVQRKHITRLFHLGIYFFCLQACLAITTNADNLIALQALGSRSVAEYAVTMRLFSVMPIILYIVLSSLWPAYGESIARGEVKWARRALSRSLVTIVVGVVIAGTLLVAFGRQIIAVWVHGRVQPSLALMTGFAVWMLLSTAANAVSVFLNGANMVRVQVLSAGATALVATGLKLLLVGRLGLPALIWSTNVAYVVCIWVPIALYLPGLLEKLESVNAAAFEAASGLGEPEGTV